MPNIKMTTEEAFIKVLQMHGIEHAFGIIGSAMMPISDLFPKAGITQAVITLAAQLAGEPTVSSEERSATPAGWLNFWPGRKSGTK